MNLKKFYFSCSQNTAIRENCYKMIYRWHLTPAKLQKMYPLSDGKCWCCQEDNADYLHIWWGCGKLKVFWKQVHSIMQKILIHLSQMKEYRYFKLSFIVITIFSRAQMSFLSISEVKEETEKVAQLEKQYKRERNVMEKQVCFISSDIYEMCIYL